MELTFDVGLARKLKHALLRNGISDLADIDWLCSDENIVKVRRLRLGQLELTAPTNKQSCNLLCHVNSCLALGAMYHFDLTVATKDRTILRTHPDLRDRMLRACTHISVEATELRYDDLATSARDAAITRALGGGHQFESEAEVFVYVTQMTAMQPKGEGGPLLNNGNVNVFYVPGRVITVSRRRGYSSGYWDFRNPGFGSVEYRAGSRVFARNRC